MKNIDASQFPSAGKSAAEGFMDSPAVDVKQNATPARHDDAIEPNTPANGSEMRAPMVVAVQGGRRPELRRGEKRWGGASPRGTDINLIGGGRPTLSFCPAGESIARFRQFTIHFSGGSRRTDRAQRGVCYAP